LPHPGGLRTRPGLPDTTPLNRTGLDRRADDVVRQLEAGDMPYLGTTLLHEEGVRLVVDYVSSL
jgi:hypothetical protein